MADPITRVERLIQTSEDYPDVNTIETVSGLYYDYVDPKPEQVDLDDVFTVLANVNRFAGHTSRPYSVGEHALLVESLVRARGGNAEQCLAALHHDDHEVYLGDIPSPLKRIIKARAPGLWEELVESCDQVILAKLELPANAFHEKIIKEADTTALRIEAADLKVSRGIGEHWGWDDLPAEIAFFQIGKMTPDPSLVKERLRKQHELLTGQPVALAA